MHTYRLAGFILNESKSFLNDSKYAVQKHAVEKFLNPLRSSNFDTFNVSQVDLFAYQTTFGSNLDPEDHAVDEAGTSISLEKDVYPHYDIILAITDFSLTAPLTAQAKVHNFRGATLHGLNDIILNSGLSVDYNFVSRQAEVFRNVITNSDKFVITFEVYGNNYILSLDCNGQMPRKAMVFVLQANLMLPTYQQVRCILFQMVLQVLSLLDFQMEL